MTTQYTITLDANMGKRAFGIYCFRFIYTGNGIVEYHEIIGEITFEANKYQGKSLKVACRDRINEELGPAKHTTFEIVPEEIEYIGPLTCKDRKSKADTLVHKELQKMGFKQFVNKATNRKYEEFEDFGPNWRAVIHQAVENVREFGLKDTRIEFSPRANQVKLINALSTGMAQPKDISWKYLLGAVCRTGKSVCSLKAAVENKKQCILVISCKCDVESSWESDFWKFTFLKGYKFITKEMIINNSSCLFGNEPKIIWVSFQSAAKDYETEDNIDTELIEVAKESWQKKLLALKFDLVIRDECHYGTRTQRSKNFIDTIIKKSHPFVLDISATPFKQISEYTAQNSYIYGIEAEHEDFLKGIIKVDAYIPIVLMHLDIWKAYKQSCLQEDGKRDSQAVKAQNDAKFEKCITEGRFSWQAYFSEFSPESVSYHFMGLWERFFKKTGNNTIVFVNNVKHAEVLASAVPLSKFNVFNVAGNIRKADIEQINKAMAEADAGTGKSVVIISCGRLLTGVTLTHLQNVVFMGTCHSAENYIQYFSRARNMYPGRHETFSACTVYDLNTESFIQTDAFKEYISAVSRHANASINEVIKRFEPCIELYELNDGKLLVQKKDWAVTVEQSFSTLRGCVNASPLDNITDLSIYKDIVIDSHFAPLRNGITEQQLEKAQLLTNVSQNDVDTPTRDPVSKEDVTNISKIIQAIKDEINFIPGFMHYRKITSFENVISKKELVEAYTIWSPKSFNVSQMLVLKKYLYKTGKEFAWKDLCHNIEMCAEDPELR